MPIPLFHRRKSGRVNTNTSEPTPPASPGTHATQGKRASYFNAMPQPVRTNGAPASDEAPDVTGFNFAEKLLADQSKLETVLEGIFSPDINKDATPVDPQVLNAGWLGDIASQIDRIGKDAELVAELRESAKNGGMLDDHKYTMEKLIDIISSLPSGSKSQNMGTQIFIKKLWDNLHHPPLSYLGDEWKYRTADGSNNNRMFPHLGQAGSPYARSVKPKIQLSPVLPDAGLLFDELLARDGKARKHPTDTSSMLFYLASIIIHDIFRTDSQDYSRVTSSSYLDLSPLYGHNDEEQRSVRTMKDGKLKPDAFAEVRLLGFPPGVAALVICFNRYHNYIAEQLALINEGNRFDLQPRLSPAEKKKYGTAEAKRDNDLFQTARLITSGLYVNIILIDYVRAILNLNRSHSDWSLDPRANYGNIFGKTGVPEGVGNQVSVEFNLIYRWHCSVSDRDEEWTVNFFNEAVPGADPATISTQDLGKAFGHFLYKLGQADPGTYEIGGLKRQTEGPNKGSFKDDELIELITSSTDDVAGAFGAHNIPKVLRSVEMLGIQQARQWNLATLNEVREYFGLTPHKTFSDISTDPSVQKSLETFYGDPDHVEFYPGILVEDGKQPMAPGSGLCPGYTVSKAILSDAVTLVRGDRFYTTDFDARTLTNWGFTEISSNKQIAGGGVFYKLLMRAFKNYYKGNSAYALFPFTPAETTRQIARSLNNEQLYDYSKPSYTAEPHQFHTIKAIKEILGDHDRFKVPWGPHTFEMTKRDYMLSGDSPMNRAQHKFIHGAMIAPQKWSKEIRELYERTTSDVIEQYGHKMRNGFQIDMVAEVANLANAIAVGKLFHIPLKLKNHKIGMLTAPAFYTAASVLFAYVFLDVDPASHYALKLGAQASGEGMLAVIKLVVELVQASNWDVLHKLLGYFLDIEDYAKDYGTKLIQRLSIGQKDPEAVAASILPTIAGAVPTQSQGLAQAIDLFFSDKYQHHWAEIQKLSRSDDPADFEKLRKYGLEAMRLASPAVGVFRTVDVDEATIQDGDEPVTVKRGQTIFPNFLKAGMDATVFPNPEEIDITRPEELYIHQGYGAHECIGREINRVALAAQLRVLGRLKNLRRAPGPAGQIKSAPIAGFKVFLRPDWSSYWPFPTSMKMLYDDFEKPTPVA